MHVRLPGRAGAPAPLAIAGLLGTLLIAAPSAPAATISACQKRKSGTIRIVSSKARCRKSEKKIKWSTTVPAYINGANGKDGAPGLAGVNGTNGGNGAAGPAGPGATRFSGTGAATLARATIASFSAGGVDFRVRCSDLGLSIAVGLEAKSAAATTVFASGVVAKQPSNPGVVFQTATLTAGADFTALDSGLTTDAGPNQGVFTYVVDTGSRTIVLHAAFAVSTNCTVTGWAAPST